MKYFYSFILIILFTSGVAFSQNYQLVWADEFNGTSLDLNSWTRETGGTGWGNAELEYYTDREDNSYVQDGVLTIKAQKETFGNRNYTSARMKTQSKRFYKYGKIEARIKLPYGQGIWPAFWMLGENVNSVGWPACGEIDIMEMVGGTTGNNSDKKIYGTAHWEQNGHASYGGNYTLSSGVFADDFHTFSIVWDPQKISWFVDDKIYVTIDITPSALDEFKNEFFIILNLAVGGNWPGSPNGTTVFPQTMQVDYVRVYQDITELPDINIINPINNSVINPGTNLTINADVQFGGIVSRVDFFQDAVKIGETIYAPYNVNLLNVSPGCYNVNAVAYTDKGYVSSSEKINFKVGNNCIEAPYKIVPANIPGEIEAENFNIGGQGVAYNDADVTNNGSSYRVDDGVDIEECSDDNEGYDVGWLAANEWMNYLVDVKEDGEYDIEVRVASNNSGGGSFHIEFDGVDKTGTINVSNTGGWQIWTTVISNSFQINAGIQNMRFVVNSGSFNLNKFGIYSPNSTAQIDLLSPNGGESWEAGTVQEIRWNSLKVSDVKIGLSTNGGTSWVFLSGKTTSDFGVYRWKVSDTPSENCLIQIVDYSDFSITDVSENKFIISNTTGIDDNENSVNSFSLMQNYPNPFNPTTKIRYSIPTVMDANSLPAGRQVAFTTNVQLKIYDILGNEITTLVNEQKLPGTYEINFDASKLPSGVYYYRLKAGDFNETRKLVLLK